MKDLDAKLAACMNYAETILGKDFSILFVVTSTNDGGAMTNENEDNAVALAQSFIDTRRNVRDVAKI